MKHSLSAANVAQIRRLPLFSIERRNKESKSVWSGRLERVGALSTGWLGYLLSEKGDVVLGRWLEINEQKTRGQFEADEVVRGALAAVDHWRFIGFSYWGERVALVLSRRSWNESKFTAKDSISYPPDGGQPKLSRGGWDHEHCASCMGKIGCGGDERGYESEGDWICGECHDRYVAPVSLDFLDDLAIAQSGGLVSDSK